MPISSYPEAARALIGTSEEDTHRFMTKSYGLHAYINTKDIIGTQTHTNIIMEFIGVHGVKATRTIIADEIKDVMANMGIDPLLADVITYKGEVPEITRFGLT